MTATDSYLFDKEKQKSGIFARLLKFIFWISAFILIVITILANMGGAGEMWRQSVEEFISDAFGGRPTKVSTLHNMTFFPSVGVHATNIKVLSKPEDEGGYPVVRIGQIEAFMSFWSVATGTPKFKKFSIQNVEAIKGMFFPEEFSIHQIFVDHTPGEDHANMVGNGTIGNHEWAFNAVLNVHKGATRSSYSFPDSIPFTLDIADIHIEGNMVKGGKEFFKLQNTTLQHQGNNIQIDLDVYTVSQNLLKIKGDIQSEKSGVKIVPELLLDKAKARSSLSGEIAISNADIRHQSNVENEIASALSRLKHVFGYKEIISVFDYMSSLEAGRDADIIINLENAHVGEEKTMHLSVPYMQVNGNRKIGPIKENGNDAVLFPVMLFTHDEKESGTFVLTKGNVDTAFATAVFAKIPNALKTEKILQNECGIGSYTMSENETKLEFSADIHGKILEAETRKLNKGEGYADIKWALTNGNASQNIIVSDAEYNFIHKHLRQASPNPTKCDNRIKKKNTQKEK